MAKKMTMREVAKLANVSQPTVSRVINGNKDVSEEIVKRVMQVIEEVGFVPNKTAQTLKRNQSKLIGISVTEIYNPYFVELIDHLESEARKRGYNIILHNSKHNSILEWENIQNFMARQIDGFLLVPTGEYNIPRISKLPIPSVVVTQSIKGFDSVGLNHLQAGRLVAEQFMRAGHDTFGYIGIDADDKFRGFENTLYENQMHFNPENFIAVPDGESSNLLIRKAIEGYLEQNKEFPFSCVFASNDVMALEFMKIAQERGIRIPEDISLIGFDDTYLAKVMGISSIHQPIEEMITTTLTLLINRIEQEVASETVSIQLEPTLIERSSSRHRRT
jgi:LacI family transcriptional regulator